MVGPPARVPKPAQESKPVRGIEREIMSGPLWFRSRCVAPPPLLESLSCGSDLDRSHAGSKVRPQLAYDDEQFVGGFS